MHGNKNAFLPEIFIDRKHSNHPGASKEARAKEEMSSPAARSGETATWRLAGVQASLGIRGPNWWPLLKSHVHKSIIVMRCLKGPINWSPLCREHAFFPWLKKLYSYNIFRPIERSKIVFAIFHLLGLKTVGKIYLFDIERISNYMLVYNTLYIYIYIYVLLYTRGISSHTHFSPLFWAQ